MVTGTNRPPDVATAAAPLTNENFGGGVIDADGFEDGRAIVGHRHRAARPPTQQDLILKRRKSSGRNQSKGSGGAVLCRAALEQGSGIN